MRVRRQTTNTFSETETTSETRRRERMANLFARKPLDRLMAEAQEVGEHSLKRSLGPMNLVALGIGCAFAGLCYAEFASMIPVAGSAYTYSYATMGEFV